MTTGIPEAKEITHVHVATNGKDDIGPFLNRGSAEYVVRCRTSVIESKSARGEKVDTTPWKVRTEKAND